MAALLIVDDKQHFIACTHSTVSSSTYTHSRHLPCTWLSAFSRNNDITPYLSDIHINNNTSPSHRTCSLIEFLMFLYATKNILTTFLKNKHQQQNLHRESRHLVFFLLCSFLAQEQNHTPILSPIYAAFTCRFHLWTFSVLIGGRTKSKFRDIMCERERVVFLCFHSLTSNIEQTIHRAEHHHLRNSLLNWSKTATENNKISSHHSSMKHTSFKVQSNSTPYHIESHPRQQFPSPSQSTTLRPHEPHSMKKEKDDSWDSVLAPHSRCYLLDDWLSNRCHNNNIRKLNQSREEGQEENVLSRILSKQQPYQQHRNEKQSQSNHIPCWLLWTSSATHVHFNCNVSLQRNVQITDIAATEEISYLWEVTDIPRNRNTSNMNNDIEHYPHNQHETPDVKPCLHLFLLLKTIDFSAPSLLHSLLVSSFPPVSCPHSHLSLLASHCSTNNIGTTKSRRKKTERMNEWMNEWQGSHDEERAAAAMIVSTNHRIVRNSHTHLLQST